MTSCCPQLMPLAYQKPTPLKKSSTRIRPQLSQTRSPRPKISSTLINPDPDISSTPTPTFSNQIPTPEHFLNTYQHRSLDFIKTDPKFLKPYPHARKFPQTLSTPIPRFSQNRPRMILNQIPTPEKSFKTYQHRSRDFLKTDPK